MEFEQLHTLLKPEKLPYLSGVQRLPDGVLHVAVLTRMPGVLPNMIGRWFGDYMETTEDYKRWHPRDHVWMSWADKRPGTHVGAKHLVHEYTRSTDRPRAHGPPGSSDALGVRAPQPVLARIRGMEKWQTIAASRRKCALGWRDGGGAAW